MAKLKVNPDGITGTDLETGETVNLPSLKGNYNVLPAESPITNTTPKGAGGKIASFASGVSNFFGAKGIVSQFGSSLARANIPGAEKLGIPKLDQQAKNLVPNPSMKEVVGSAIQTGANLIPGAGAIKGVGLLGKVAAGAGTGYAFDVGSNLQDKNKSVGESFKPGIGTAVGTALPIGGAVIKPASAVLGRLFKGLGSGLSGVPTKTIDQILENPEVAKKASQRLTANGNYKVLEENARQIINGVSNIRNQARKAFGEGLEQLSEKDIKPDVFRGEVQAVLDKYGSVMERGKRGLKNVEFSDPKNVEKASTLIKSLNSAKLDGKSMRKLADDIENAKYKIATSDERLSFNAFLQDLSGSLKSAIDKSTDKLGEINAKFSGDMQLAETVENIFGKVNFRNLPEVVKASQKLESLFSQKGLAPDVVDTFLKRIGVAPQEFRTGEAVRQITDKSTGANTKGLSVGELVQQTTSAIITPEMVKNIAIGAGIAKEKLAPFLSSLSTQARNAVIQALLQVQKSNQPQTGQ